LGTSLLSPLSRTATLKGICFFQKTEGVEYFLRPDWILVPGRIPERRQCSLGRYNKDSVVPEFAGCSRMDLDSIDLWSSPAKPSNAVNRLGVETAVIQARFYSIGRDAVQPVGNGIEGCLLAIKSPSHSANPDRERKVGIATGMP